VYEGGGATIEAPASLRPPPLHQETKPGVHSALTVPTERPKPPSNPPSGGRGRNLEHPRDALISVRSRDPRLRACSNPYRSPRPRKDCLSRRNAQLMHASEQALYPNDPNAQHGTSNALIKYPRHRDREQPSTRRAAERRKVAGEDQDETELQTPVSEQTHDLPTIQRPLAELTCFPGSRGA
jgi:hypothetical protein